MHSSALRALECIVWGGAVQQVTLRQVTPKLVTLKLVRESERLVMQCAFSAIVSSNLSTSIFGIG